jgi:CheY-like chemotaxis protein
MKTVLFADDRRSIREYCRVALENEGYHVLLASDGLDAVRVFREEAPDLAILDISMPRASGLEALEQIRTFAPQVPVILFTANDEECLRDRRASLATACIGKTEDLTELKRAIAGALLAREEFARP